ncbi:sensor histidine kinase [Deinococcus sp.]|uniref:sensor histidine kinase n=1 Tax=Deinococcus sp. TaxID=47478 RepID=UPI003CC6331B
MRADTSRRGPARLRGIRSELTLLLLLCTVGSVLLECLLLVESLSRRLSMLPPALLTQTHAALFGSNSAGSLPLLFLRTSLLPLALGTVVSVLLSVLLARQYARPLAALGETLSRLASGDLSARPTDMPARSESARLAHDVTRLGERLQAADEERRYANAAVAHELRTPITVLRARLVALQDGLVPLNAPELGKLARQLEVLTRLADDLQLITQTELGPLPLELQDCDLAALVTEVAASMAAAGALIEVQTGGSPLVRGDPVRLRQVVSNVLDNALRYSPPKMPVQVRLWVQQAPGTAVPCACIQVEDAGAGVSEGALGQLFDRYFRADESRTRSTGGSGMGLAIVKALVEAHGGYVAAGHSALGGLNLSIWLPVTHSASDTVLP